MHWHVVNMDLLLTIVKLLVPPFFPFPDLLGFLSSSVMLPPKRLQQLLSQAVQLQIDKCPFHYMDMDVSECSLLTDHICTR